MKVKFCGITRAEDAREAVRLGAWAIGLNHWSGSPRRCDPATAAAISAELRRQIEIVGVFVNASLAEIAAAVENEQLGMVQLHGDEGPSFCAEVARRTGAKVIKALPVHSSADIQAAEAFRTDFHLLDAHIPGARGGTGASFDWELAARASTGDPADPRRRPQPRQRRRGDRDRAPARGRRRQRDRVGARDQGPRVDGRVRRAREPGARGRRAAAAVSGAAGGAGTAAGVEERFGPYGGRFVPEVLMAALDELSLAWATARDDERFRAELDGLLRDFVGRPTPLYLAERLSERVGRRVYLKREDLAHTGAHKINNAVGQALLAKRMGKTRVIAETGAGQHGVASATACALLGLECVVYMGTEDMRRQAPNVERMRLLGAEVAPVEAGARTLKEAVSAAIRDWVTNVATTHYIIGSAVGPAPYPALVRDLQLVIGLEAREQALAAEGVLPSRVIACVGGGSNAIGTFVPFVDDAAVELIGVEAAGEGVDSGRTGASLTVGRTGVLHGALSSVLSDADGQVLEAHSVSAGLDYPGVGPQHAFLRDSGRVRYVAVTDDEALRAFRELARLEGIIPALEPSHAIAWLFENSHAIGESRPRHLLGFACGGARVR